MDANGSRFHLFLGRGDWGGRCATAAGQSLSEVLLASEAGAEGEFSWDEARHELTLGKRVFYFTSSLGNRPVDPQGRRGAGADAYGNVYWIAESGTEILVHSSGSGTTSHFWSSLDGSCKRKPGLFGPLPDGTPARPIALAGLAVTTTHFLIVGAKDPAGLLVFDLHGGGDPRQLLWPVAFEPFDLAGAADGGLWVLDRERKRVWRLDRTMGVVPLGGVPAAAGAETFQPIDGDGPAHGAPASPITSDMGAAIAASDPLSIEVLPDDSVLILDSPPGAAFSRILRLRHGVEVAGASTDVAASVVEEAQRPGFRLLGHDFVFMAKRTAAYESAENVLYVAASDGDQAFAFRLDIAGDSLVLHVLAEFFPMRLFGARALIASGEQPAYDAQDRWVPLVAQPRSRYAQQGTLSTSYLDGKKPDCVWHRLTLDACLPAESDVVVWSRAGNDPQLLEFGAWQKEPRLLRRPGGSELPWSGETSRAGIGTWELLFQRARGRYLQLKLELRGSGRSSPRIRALRAWYPRFSYLDAYLPAVYRENEESASFLDRYLANMEGFFTSIEDRIAAAQVLLEPRCAPAESLEWLASWFGVALDPAWDDARRRLFLRYASRFFEWRGTVPGLMMALRLVFEECADESIFALTQKRRTGPRIVEQFCARRTPPSVFSDTSDPVAGLPLRLAEERWHPALGANDLHLRWAKWAGRPGEKYPIRAAGGADPERAAQWAEFSRETLGFVPGAAETDLGLWQELLRRRYRSVEDVSREWPGSYENWSDLRLPGELPETVGALRDWVQLEGVVLPARASAHRFTVFLPQATLGLQDREKRLDLARRVINLEKPAHAAFEVKFYWAFFRVGEARVGEDTVVDLGSRSPELLSQFVLDRSHLGSGWLAPEHQSRASSARGCAPCTRGGIQ